LIGLAAVHEILALILVRPRDVGMREHPPAVCSGLGDTSSIALAWRVPAGSFSLAEPSDPRVRASPVRGPLRATRARTVRRRAAAHRGAIPSSVPEAPGSSRLGPGESAPERALVRSPPTDRSRTARHTIRHLERP